MQTYFRRATYTTFNAAIKWERSSTHRRASHEPFTLVSQFTLQHSALAHAICCGPAAAKASCCQPGITGLLRDLWNGVQADLIAFLQFHAPSCHDCSKFWLTWRASGLEMSSEQVQVLGLP